MLKATDLDRTATPDGAPEPHGSIVMELLRRARERLAGFDDTELREVRLAIRAIPADGLPVVGWAAGCEALYVVATHSGYTLAFQLADLVADEVGGRRVAELEQYRPSRQAIEPTTAVTS